MAMTASCWPRSEAPYRRGPLNCRSLSALGEVDVSPVLNDKGGNVSKNSFDGRYSRE